MAGNGHGKPAKRRRLMESIDGQDVPYDHNDFIYTGYHLTSPQVSIQTGVLQGLTRQYTGDGHLFPGWPGDRYQQPIQGPLYVDPQDTILGNTHESPADALILTGTSARPRDVGAQPSYPSGSASYTSPAMPVIAVQNEFVYESSAVPSTPELSHRASRVPAADTARTYAQEPSRFIDITAMSATQSSRGRQPSNTPRSSAMGSRICDECGVECETAKHLERHKIKEHCDKVPCELCGKLLKRRSDNDTRHLKVCKGFARSRSDAGGTNLASTNDDASVWSVIDASITDYDVDQQVASGQSGRRESKMPMRLRNSNDFAKPANYQQSSVNYERLYDQESSSAHSGRTTTSGYNDPSNLDRVNTKFGTEYSVSRRSPRPSVSSYAASNLSSINEESRYRFAPSYEQGPYHGRYQPGHTHASSSRSASNDPTRVRPSPWIQPQVQLNTQGALDQGGTPNGALATNMYGSAGQSILDTIGSAPPGVHRSSSAAGAYPVDGVATTRSPMVPTREAPSTYDTSNPLAAPSYNTTDIDDDGLNQLLQSINDFDQYGYNPQRGGYDARYSG